MLLTIIGCGDAFGSGGRFNTCFHLEADGACILVDCGASSMVALRQRGVAIDAIDAIVLSHLHGDHFGGLPFFLLESQRSRARPLTIAGPPGTRERLWAAMEVFFPGASRLEWKFSLEVNEIALDTPSAIAGFDLRSTEVVHPSGAPSTALRLSRGGRTLSYSGDTEWTDRLVQVADGADLFVVECTNGDRDTPGHIGFATLMTHRERLSAKKIMLTHMGTSMLARTDEARAAGFLIAEDGLTIEF